MNEELVLREAEAGSGSYQEMLALRYAELRVPLGLEWVKGELLRDRKDRHFGVFRESELLGTAVVCDLGGGTRKLRQIAITREYQGRGFGRALMELLESLLQGEQVQTCELNARISVAGFYRALDYLEVGEVFEEVGIPHVQMRKAL